MKTALNLQSPNRLNMGNVSTSTSIGSAPQTLQDAINSNRTGDAILLMKQTGLTNGLLPNGHTPLAYAIRLGNLELVQEMFRQLPLGTEVKDSQGLTAVDHAMITQNQKMIALVVGQTIGREFDAAASKAMTPIQLKEIQSFVTEVEKIRSGSHFQNLPQSHKAARAGNLEEVKKHLNPKDPNAYDQYGMTPLHHAILAGKKEVAQWLLQQNGVQADILTQSGRSLVHLASIGGHADLIPLVIAKLGPNSANASDMKGKTPLHYAFTLEDLRAAKALIQNGANPVLVDLTFSPLEMLLSLAKERSAKKDPLALTGAQCLTFAAIAAPWIAKLCGDHPVLDVLGTLTGWGAFFMTLENFQASQQTLAKTAFLAANVVNVAGEMHHHFLEDVPPYSIIRPIGKGDEWLLGINSNGESMPRSLMALDAGIEATTCYQVAKASLKGLVNCWKNRSLETFRPIRNALVHSVIGAHTVQTKLERIGALYEHSKLYDAWDKFMSEDSHVCDGSNLFIPKSSNGNCFKFGTHSGIPMDIPVIEEFKYSYFGRSGSGSGISGGSKPTYCGTADSICSGKSEVDCTIALNPDKCTDHAKKILDFSGLKDCKKAFRKLSLTYHPDKCQRTMNKEICEQAFINVNASAETLGCSNNTF